MKKRHLQSLFGLLLVGLCAACGRLSDDDDANSGGQTGRDTTEPNGLSLEELSKEGANAAPTQQTGITRNHVVDCADQDPLILDFHQALLPSAHQPAPEIDLGDSVESTLETFRDLLGEFPFLEEFNEALEKVRHPKEWTLTPLQTLPDQEVAYVLPEGCSLHLAVVRQDDVFFLDPHWEANLSPSQRGVLWVHEALVELGREANEHFIVAAKVRNLIAAWLRVDREPGIFADRLHQFGAEYEMGRRLPKPDSPRLKSPDDESVVVSAIYLGFENNTTQGFRNVEMSLGFTGDGRSSEDISARCTPQSSGRLLCTSGQLKAYSLSGFLIAKGGQKVIFLDESGEETDKIYVSYTN